MFIVDSQIHVWAASTPERPWPAPGADGRSATPQRDIPFGIEEALGLMDEAGINRAVIVPPSWEGDYNDLALAAAYRHPDRFAVMGRIAPERPEAPAQIAVWRKQPGMLGLRFMFNAHAPWLADGDDKAADYWLWGAAEKAGLPITLMPHAWYWLVEQVAERYPGLKLCIDHMGCASSRRDAEAFTHMDQLLRLARFPNVAVKASALPCCSSAPYPWTWLHPEVRKTYDAFGPQRMFWGTDISRSPCGYRENVELFTRELSWLTPADLEWIMGRGVCEWYGWPR